MSVEANQVQAEFWNADPGRNWVRFQPEMDVLLGSVSDLVLAEAAPQDGERAIDIGCGAGATTLATAERVGPRGYIAGVDISGPLLARAEERRRDRGLTQAEFLLADAQVHAFSPGATDLILSRFGVMFFDDPLAAFRNLATALHPGGRLVMACWAELPANPFFASPGRIAAARLGPPDPSDPDAPGPMAFRDRDRVSGILKAAGFTDIHADRIALDLHHPGGVEVVLAILGHIGGLARLMRERGGTAADMEAILGGIREAYADFAAPDGIRVPAMINLFSATRA